MQQVLLDFLLKQLPVIVVLGIFNYFMYKYFTKVIEDKEAYFTKIVDSRDKIIVGKDEDIKNLNLKILDITTRCLQAMDRANDSTNKTNEIMSGLQRLIEKLVFEKKQ